jgi:Tol biopolymer transport system component
MSFLQEIKRRKVFKVAAVYAVVAWLIIQIIGEVSEPLSLPGWFETVVIVLLAVGFPIALILSWAFDLTPQGIEATPAAGGRPTRAPAAAFTYVVQGLVLIAVVFLIVDQYVLKDGGGAAAVASSGTASGAAAPGGPLMRFTVTLPDGVRFSIGEDFDRSAAISPDGRRVVFTGVDEATGTARLYVRPLGSVEATPLLGTEDGNSLFWAPDSQSVGFFGDGKAKRVDLSGGPAIEISDAASTAGAAWSEDGYILASLDTPGPLFRIPLDGGAPTQVTALDKTAETDHRWPQLLDDGERFLYLASGATVTDGKVYAASFGSDSRTLLLDGVGAYVYAYPDQLIYSGGGGVLLAQTFDREHLRMVGEPRPIATNVQGPISASRAGPVTYRTVSSAPLPMIWIGRDGSAIGPAAEPGYYTDPAISPDGTAVAFASSESPEDNYHIAILDFATGATRQLTLNSAGDRAPTWSPDGASIVFLSFRPEGPGLYRKASSGVGAEERIFASPGVAWPYDWRDGKMTYFAGVSGNNDVWEMSPDHPDDAAPLIRSSFNNVDGTVSPDGAWFAYSANDTGRFEIYVTTYPPSSTKLIVTSHGGSDPFWSPDGTQLFYVQPSTAELMALDVTPGNPPRFGAARRIHPGPLFYPAARSYAWDPKTERFLLAPSFNPSGDITILLNWRNDQG